MAKESLKKEKEILRLLFLYSGAYDKQQLLERLGISPTVYEKTIAKLQTTFDQKDEEVLVLERNKRVYPQIKYDYMKQTSNVLAILFETKAIRESEIFRWIHILKICQKPRSLPEVIDRLSEDPKGLDIDEKTVRRDLKFLQGYEMIQIEQPSKNKYFYHTCNPFAIFTKEELLEIFSYVDYCANREAISSIGFLLRDSLLKQLNIIEDIADPEIFLYKHSSFSSILDEETCFQLLNYIAQRQPITIQYYKVISDQRYESANTNPLYKREKTAKAHTIIPVQLLYDHHYGRWYLFAKEKKKHKGFLTFRIETILSIAKADREALSPEDYQRMLIELEQRLETSWNVELQHPIEVELKFAANTAEDVARLLERVEKSKRHGMIESGPDPLCFFYKIKVNQVEEIRPWIRSFGQKVKVLKPASLRENMLAEWKEVLSYYGDFT
jgi:predicted DNA-binding transcriptional regulator YafY